MIQYMMQCCVPRFSRICANPTDLHQKPTNCSTLKHVHFHYNVINHLPSRSLSGITLEGGLLVYQRRSFFSKLGTEPCPVEMYQSSRRNFGTESVLCDKRSERSTRASLGLILCEISLRDKVDKNREWLIGDGLLTWLCHQEPSHTILSYRVDRALSNGVRHMRIGAREHCLLYTSHRIWDTAVYLGQSTASLVLLVRTSTLQKPRSFGSFKNLFLGFSIFGKRTSK